MHFQINEIKKIGFSKNKEYRQKDVEEIFFDDKNIHHKIAKIAELLI